MFKILSALATHYFFIHKSSICTTAKKMSCWATCLLQLHHNQTREHAYNTIRTWRPKCTRQQQASSEQNLQVVLLSVFWLSWFIFTCFVCAVFAAPMLWIIYYNTYWNIYYNTVYTELSQSLFFFPPKRASRRMFCKHCAFHIMFGVSCTCNEANNLISYKCFMLYLCPHFSVQSYPWE